MPNNENHFEGLVNRAVADAERRQGAMERASGIGTTPPFGHVKLSRQEKVAYFQSQPPQKQQELWGQMDDSERQMVGQG